MSNTERKEDVPFGVRQVKPDEIHLYICTLETDEAAEFCCKHAVAIEPKTGWARCAEHYHPEPREDEVMK